MAHHPPRSLLLVLGLLAAGPAWSQDAAPAVAPEAGPDLSGTWRMDLSLTTEAKVPVIGKTVIQTDSIYIVEISGPPDAPVQEQRVCSITPNSSRSVVTTTIPDTFINAMPAKRFPLALTDLGDGRWRVVGDMQPLAIGFNRERSPGGVPQQADHPAIGDHEGDGHPGATVHLSAPLFGKVEVYMVQHARTVVDGVWSGGDLVEGSATVNDFGQRTVGASNRLFIANPELRAVPETSIFRLARVPAATTCAQLVRGVGAG